MKKKWYAIFIIILPLILVGAGERQNDGFLDGLIQKLAKYNKSYPDEKVYVQTDKTYYRQNEYLWYKAYLLNSNDNKPSKTSDVLYIELKDPKGNVVAKHEHKLESGVCDGNFFFTENMAGGLYTLAGYTKWMTNRGDDFLFKKEITVQKVITPRLLLKLDFDKRAYGAGDEVIGILSVSDLRNNKTTGSTVKSEVKIGGTTVQVVNSVSHNGESRIKFNLPSDLKTSDGLLQVIVTEKGISESVSKSIPIILNKITLNFFPEGGELIENVTGRVAFEGLNEFGKGADASGIIVDDKGKTAAHFESFHLGMGAFEFTPETGKTYYAKIEKPQGINGMFMLPKAKQSGYSLNLKSKNEQSAVWTIYAPTNVNLALTGQTQGIVYYKKRVSLKSGYNEISVDLKNFPVGVAVFTLFDEKDKENCERLVYVNPHKGLSIKLETDKKMYEPQEEVKLSVKTVDANNNPVAANLALSVVDEQLLAMADDKQDNMLSYVLFSSELKGKIQEPFFYFDNTQPKAKEAVDYLMLTHGWRRFTWKDVQQEIYPKISVQAEKVAEVSGYLKDKKGNTRQGIIYLIECEGKRRIAKLKTDITGKFIFRNVDLSSPVLLATRLPNRFVMNTIVGTDDDSKTIGVVDMNNKEEVASVARITMKEYLVPEIIHMDEDILEIAELREHRVIVEEEREMNEVVVIPMGMVKRKEMVAAAVNVVKQNEILNNINDELKDREFLEVAPIDKRIKDNKVVQNKSKKDENKQLIIYNGTALEKEENHSVAEFVNVENIELITISKSRYGIPAIYKKADNLIYIDTKKIQWGSSQDRPKYSGLILPKREFYSSDVFSQDEYNPDQDNTTVYWNAHVTTDEKGKAKLVFRNNNTTSSFRITAEGIAPAAGLIGSEIVKIATEKPFAIDVKTPVFASIGDTVRLPVMLRNATEKVINAKVKLSLPDALLPVGEQEMTVEIMPGSTQMAYMGFLPTNKKGEHQYTISALSDTESDEIKRTVTIRSVYFPQSYSISGRKMEDLKNFKLGDHVPGSFRAEAVCYTNCIDELFAGMESILREPYGCFEQTSSSTYPNIMVLQAMNSTGLGDEKTRQHALKLLDTGYKRLAAYEVKGGGFEWFGKDPAHTGLTAYGVLEFNDMKKVYDGVDNEMTERARRFILGRRDGNGGFVNNTMGLDDFSGSPKSISDAYIVYALTETKETGIDKEYRFALHEALESKDLYRMALMANAAFNMGDRVNYRKLVKYFIETADPSKFEKMKMQTSITRSSDLSLTRETVALWTIAMLKANDNVEREMIDTCVEYLSACRTPYGGFGNTQSTILCLQALTRYAGAPVSLDKGKLSILVNDKKADLDLTRKTGDEKQMSVDISDLIDKGDNEIRLLYSDIETPLPYSINFYWDYKTPVSNRECPLVITTKLMNHTVKRNETTRLSVTMENKKNNGLPMSIAIIGIPGGMSLQPWQLKELQEKEVFDFYEIIDDNLIIYYRQMKPNERRQINLDLKAEIPGTYTGMASCTYVYYTNEYKYWLEGMNVNITE